MNLRLSFGIIFDSFLFDHLALHFASSLLHFPDTSYVVTCYSTFVYKFSGKR